MAKQWQQFEDEARANSLDYDPQDYAEAMFMQANGFLLNEAFTVMTFDREVETTRETFEFESCAECEGDFDDHHIINVLGHPFFQCKN
jgi:hypothetical protein